MKQKKSYKTGELMYRYDHDLLPPVCKVLNLTLEMHSHWTKI